ncbi:ABC transporter ATP-binding protein [candidate division KSB1 bacterium]
MNKFNTNNSSGSGEIVVKISNLKKNFGSLAAVDGISFDIVRGEIFGFLGPNGAGKTTTINMICGLSPPSGGEIFFYGKNSKDRERIRTRIGICPQENIFWHKLTCHEQLVFMCEMYGLRGKKAKKRSLELLERMALTEKAHVPATRLSGGMKRRLNICLALINDPEILVLDEPEAGLDPQSRVMVRDYIKSLAQTKTIIFTTHNMDEADRMADRVAIIDYGKLLTLDTPSNLKRSIGEGDIVEISFEESDSGKLPDLSAKLGSEFDNITGEGHILTIRSKNLIESIYGITETIKSMSLSILEMKMRENTLEDVFIHLTGRKLRQ